MKKVITWRAPNSATINLTQKQEKLARQAGYWPRNQNGEEYCTVSHGLHVGTPTWGDKELKMIIHSMESASPEVSRDER